MEADLGLKVPAAAASNGKTKFLGVNISHLVKSIIDNKFFCISSTAAAEQKGKS